MTQCPLLPVHRCFSRSSPYHLIQAEKSQYQWCESVTTQDNKYSVAAPIVKRFISWFVARGWWQRCSVLFDFKQNLTVQVVMRLGNISNIHWSRRGWSGYRKIKPQFSNERCNILCVPPIVTDWIVYVCVFVGNKSKEGSERKRWGEGCETPSKHSPFISWRSFSKALRLLLRESASTVFCSIASEYACVLWSPLKTSLTASKAAVVMLSLDKRSILLASDKSSSFGDRPSLPAGLRGVRSILRFDTPLDSSSKLTNARCSSSSFELFGFGVRSTNPANITTIPNQNPIHWLKSNALNSLKNIPPDTIVKNIKLHCSNGMMNNGLNILSCYVGE